MLRRNMSKVSLLTIILGIGVIVASVIVKSVLIDSSVSVPDIDTRILESIEPVLDQSFEEDLQSRAQNAVGVELEL